MDLTRIMDDRRLYILEQRKQNRSYASLGRELGISSSYVGVLCREAWMKQLKAYLNCICTHTGKNYDHEIRKYFGADTKDFPDLIEQLELEYADILKNA